jgi:GMP synthase-like glutamine amidotransferase
VANGRPGLIFQHASFEGPGAVAGAITAAGHSFEVVRLDQGEPIPDGGRLEAMPGLVVLGGPMSVHEADRYPWLAPGLHWHADTFDLPEGSTRLAQNEAYPNQAFVVGGAAYGLQFHVEVTASLVAHWGPHLPPGVFVRAPDIAHISRSGAGLLRRFIALAER